MADLIKRIPVRDQDYHPTVDASGNPYFDELARDPGGSQASEVARFNATRFLHTNHKEGLGLSNRVVIGLVASTVVAIATDLGGSRSAFFSLFG